MHVDINIPQSKSISIAFAVLRHVLLIFIATSIYSSSNIHLPNSYCLKKLDSYSQLVNILALVALFLNSVTILYFYCSNRFPKFEYYIYYIVHICFTLYLIISAIVFLVNGREISCPEGTQLVYTLLITSVIINLVYLLVMIVPIDISIKAVNVGGSLVWPVIWYFSRKEAKQCQTGVLLADVVAVLHLIILAITFVTFTLVTIMKKTSQTARAWKFVVLLSLLFMAVSYTLVGISRLQVDSDQEACQYKKFYQRMYFAQGWIQILPPLLLLIFIRSEQGDMREKVLKSVNNENYKLIPTAV